MEVLFFPSMENISLKSLRVMSRYLYYSFIHKYWTGGENQLCFIFSYPI